MVVVIVCVSVVAAVVIVSVALALAVVATVVVVVVVDVIIVGCCICRVCSIVSSIGITCRVSVRRIVAISNCSYNLFCVSWALTSVLFVPLAMCSIIVFTITYSNF